MSERTRDDKNLLGVLKKHVLLRSVVTQNTFTQVQPAKYKLRKTLQTHFNQDKLKQKS